MESHLPLKTVLIITVGLYFCVGILTGCEMFSSESHQGGALSEDGVLGCPGISMLPVPDDPGELGAWPVGSRYVKLVNSNVPERPFRVQVWYPAAPGSDAGKEKAVLGIADILHYIPKLQTDGLKSAVKTAEIQTNYCMGLPVDKSHGPYPVIVFVHGTASAIISHVKLCSHWASRGYIVLMADNPGIQMKDMLSSTPGVLGMAQSLSQFASHTQKADTEAIISHIKTQSTPFDFLKGVVDKTRIGLGGHSWGGFTVGELGTIDGVKVIVTMASMGVTSTGSVESALLLGAQDDKVLSFQDVTVAGYHSTPQKKRLVGIPNAGHMAFCDICDVIILADDFGVDLGYIGMMAFDGCNDEDKSKWIDKDISMAITIYASTAVFDETLHCSQTAGEMIDSIQSKFAEAAPGLIYESAAASSTSAFHAQRRPRIDELFRE